MTAPQLAPGSVVAQKYQLGACLGYAGSSATYQAAGADGRQAVLKIFDPGIRQRADIMAALEQTYAATNALPQDIAVPLLDAGYDPGTGAPFSVSERIPFPSMAQLAAQRALTPEEVSNVLSMMAQVLDRAHANQLFHHALKPTNVFVGFAQGYGIRITDFGAGLARTAVPTQEGYALAAPWLAPEQVQGQSPAGAAADVFSAALVAFFALTGRSYWRSCQGALDLAGWQHELMSPRTPPSARALQLGVQLNSAFDGVLGCALSPDPGQRYRTVGEFAQAMDAIAASKPPESQATMAFPAGALGLSPGGEYPPPPVPMGGMPGGGPRVPNAAMMTQPSPGQAPMAQSQPMAGGYPMAQSMPMVGGQPMNMGDMGGQQQQPAQAHQPGGNGAYPSTQNAPGQALGETAAGRPVDPAVFQRRPPSNRLAPILVGTVALLLLVGAGAAFVLMGRKPHTEGTTATAAVADTAAPAADTASAAAAVASAAPSAAPADTGSAAPADTGSAAPSDTASAAPSGEAAAGPAPVESTFTCDPECDEIKVDDKAIELGKPQPLGPGKHTVVGTKAGYQTAKDSFTLKAGDKVEKTYKLKEKLALPAGGSSPPPQGPKKPCFLKSKCK